MTLYTLENVPAKASWSLERNHVTTEGPYSNVQRIDRTGDRYRVTLQLPPLQGTNGAEIIAFLEEISNYDAWVQVTDDGYTFRGATVGTVTVNGGSQTGKTLDVQGVGTSVTGAFKRGDRVGLATGQVITIAADANSDGSGLAALSLVTPLRESPANGSHVEYMAPAIICRVASDVGWNKEPADITGVAIDLIEDITSGVPAPSY